MATENAPLPQRPIHRSTARDQVARDLRGRIMAGDWRVGEMLPSQSQLSAMFSVSVPIIREALQTLKGEGLVRVVHGKGAIIAPLDSSNVIRALGLLAQREYVTLHNLWEIRSLLEPEIAELAAIRATEAQIAELEATIEPTTDPQMDVAAWVAADIRFHTLLAEAAGNPILPLIMEVFVSLLAESMRLIRSRKPTNAPAEHAAIIAALRARDPVAARQAMLVQIESNRRDIDELEPLAATVELPAAIQERG